MKRSHVKNIITLLLNITLLTLLFSCGKESELTASEQTPAKSTPIEKAVEQPVPEPVPEPEVIYDLVIHGHRIIDPETGYDKEGWIGINGEFIEVLSEKPLKGTEVFEAPENTCVSPGFIDIQIPTRPGAPNLAENIQYWKLQDGITSAFWLHDGLSNYKKSLPIHCPNDVLINYGFSSRVNAYRRLPLNQILEKIEKDLDDGALAISLSPEYYPAYDYDDNLAFAKLADRKNVMLTMHVRSSKPDGEVAAIEEAVNLARDSGAHVHIFHLNSTGGMHKMKEALELIDSARAEGVNIDAAIYPFSYYMSFLGSTRFAPGWNEGLGIGYEDLFYVPTQDFLSEELYYKLRKNNGLTVSPEGTISWEKSMMPALKKDYIFISSDGAYDVSLNYGKKVPGHPRDTGNSGEALKVARERGIPLPEMIKKMTLLPARAIESALPVMAKRGRLSPGSYADITVFDPSVAKAGGTVLDPAVHTPGIEAVFVSGKMAWYEGEVKQNNLGRFLQRGD